MISGIYNQDIVGMDHPEGKVARRISLRPGALIRSAALRCNPGLKLFLEGIRVYHKDEQESTSGC